MRISAPAKRLSAALSLAAAVIDDKKLKLEILKTIHLDAHGDEVVLRTNILDFALTICLRDIAASDGAVVVPGLVLARLIDAFATDASVTISDADSTAIIACGRSRYRLPALSPDDFPVPLQIHDELGHVVVTREVALRIFSAPLFAVGVQESRYYLSGICLHHSEGGLCAVATDGHRLCKVEFPGLSGLSPPGDFSLIVPSSAIAIVLKLLADKKFTNVTLRRSKNLFELSGEGVVFCSKLISGTFPDYARVIPHTTGNSVVVERLALASAIARIRAVAGDGKIVPPIGLEWTEGPGVGELRLCVAGWPDIAEDPIAAKEVSGNGHLAVSIGLFAEQIDELGGELVRLDSGGAMNPLLVTNPADAGIVTLVMPMRWPLDRTNHQPKRQAKGGK